MRATGVTADLTELATQLGLQSGRLSRQLRVHGGTGLTSSQASIVSTLAGSGPICLSQLAAAEGVSAPTASTAVERLCQLGFLQRRPDPSDARRQLISLSPKGESLNRRSRDESVTLLEAALDRLDADARQALADAVPVLAELVHDLTHRVAEPAM